MATANQATIPAERARAVDVFIFVARGEGLFSRIIRRVTGGEWSHMGIGFILSDGAMVYFESLFRDGFVGPKCWASLSAWQMRRPLDRQFAWRRLHLDPDRAQFVFGRAWGFVGLLGYAKFQLIAMWWFERVGKWLNFHVPRSNQKAVCCEAVAELLDKDFSFTEPGRERIEEITPTSAWLRVVAIADAREAGGRK